MSSDRLSQRLWQDNLGWYQRCLDHPFVLGIVDGTLCSELFRSYIKQDVFFLQAFARAYSALASRTVDWNDFLELHNLANGVVEELRMHSEFAKSWSVDLDDCTPKAATEEYIQLITSSLQRNPHSLSAVVVLAPCMRLYLEIGRWCSRSDRYHLPNPYSSWVESYSSADFADLVQTLESLVDRHAVDSEETASMYASAMECEFNFFDASMEV